MVLVKQKKRFFAQKKCKQYNIKQRAEDKQNWGTFIMFCELRKTGKWFRAFFWITTKQFPWQRLARIMCWVCTSWLLWSIKCTHVYLWKESLVCFQCLWRQKLLLITFIQYFQYLLHVLAFWETFQVVVTFFLSFESTFFQVFFGCSVFGRNDETWSLRNALQCEEPMPIKSYCSVQTSGNLVRTGW